MRSISLILMLFSVSMLAQQPVSSLWSNYVQVKQAGGRPLLPDYSYSGYHFSEKEIPDVSYWEVFNVTDFGATANDNSHDDDGIQAAIDAAKASGNPAVVLFPSGRFMVSADNDINKAIIISGSNIVLKGNGSGPGGTEIHMDQMRVVNGHWQFRFQPETFNTSSITELSEPAIRDDYSVTVKSATNLSVGQSIYLSHKSEAFARAHFGNLELSTDWTRLFGNDGGMSLFECHIIAEIDGNEVTFKNPIQTDLPVLDEPYLVRNLKTIEEVGIEDILFTSGWEDYPEEFVHHKDDIHDYAWSAIQFKYVKNGWIRNCEFRHWNEGIDVRESIGVTIENVIMSGKRGHASFLTRRSYGVLVKDCVDDANHHHGPGTGYQGVSTVYLRHKMSENQSIDSHSGQPYCSLYDDLDGGDFHTNGGPHESYPHHARYMTFWNFIHKKSTDVHYDFWETEVRRPATYAEPIFVGFQPTKSVTMTGELMNEFQGHEVFPKSLFEAQLDYRLNPEKYLLGSQTIDSSSAPTVYPNPFDTVIRLRTSDLIIETLLTDISGKRVEHTINQNASETVISLPVKPDPGIYLLRIRTVKGSEEFRLLTR